MICDERLFHQQSGEIHVSQKFQPFRAVRMSIYIECNEFITSRGGISDFSLHFCRCCTRRELDCAFFAARRASDNAV